MHMIGEDDPGADAEGRTGADGARLRNRNFPQSPLCDEVGGEGECCAWSSASFVISILRNIAHFALYARRSTQVSKGRRYN
jgi:hypothetical protein